MTPRRPAALCALLLCGTSALVVAGCALTSKSEPIVSHYYSPERPADVDRASIRSSGSPAELRLGRVSSASHIEERLVYRDSEYELGYYQERRWTEAPEQYLKRRLARVLFEERGLRQVVGGPAATLEMELVAFEEIRAPKRVARVQVIVRLEDQRTVRWEETLTVDQPMAASPVGETPAAMVAALGAALRTVVDRIADRVVTELASAPLAPVRAAAEPSRGAPKPGGG